MSWYVGGSLEALLDEVNASAPGRSKASDGSIGDAAHSSRESDHNPCDCHDAVCARDFTHDPAHGFDSYAFADWLRARCDAGQERRVKYIISNGRIASPTDSWAWRPYDGSNPHTQHVHVSVDHGPESFNDDSPWQWGTGDDDMTKPTDVVGADSNGTDLTMGELSGRMNWLYEQFLALGSLKEQLNRIEEALRK